MYPDTLIAYMYVCTHTQCTYLRYAHTHTHAHITVSSAAAAEQVDALVILTHVSHVWAFSGLVPPVNGTSPHPASRVCWDDTWPSSTPCS